MQWKVVKFDTISSTNDEAMKPCYGHANVLVASRQTAGRGQRGNKWSAQPGENLTLSIVVEPVHIAVNQQFMISEMAALACVDVLTECGVVARIKWPNDIYINDLKVAGILIEHSSQGANLAKSVIGIGLNVRQEIFPPEIPNPTSLAISGITLSPEAVCKELLEAFEKRYENLENLHEDFMKNLWRAEGEHRYRAEGVEFSASIVGVDPHSGVLTLRLKNGEKRDFWFKEVEAVMPRICMRQ